MAIGRGVGVKWRSLAFVGNRVLRRPCGLGRARAVLSVALVVAATGRSALAGGTFINTVQDGAWNDASTWDLRVPDAFLADQARIAHFVTANGAGQNSNVLSVGWSAGDGVLAMTSGDLTIDNHLSVGTGGHSGHVDVSGGTMQMDELVLGFGGPGWMTVSGGLLSVSRDIKIGESATSGCLTIVGNGATIALSGSVWSSSNLRIGANGTLMIVPTADGAAGLTAIDCNQEVVLLDAASTLELDLSSYSPSVNDSWTVITDAEMISGSFGSLVAPAGFGLQQDITTSGEVIIRVMQTPCDAQGGDSDHDGVCDTVDACSGFDDRLDADADGVPDDCEADCDTNGVPDVLEIAAGSTADCNTNGVPDACDIAVTRVADVSSAAPLNSFAADDFGADSDSQLTTDGAGNWIAVWTTVDDLGGTIGTEGDILYSRSTDHGATWTAAAPLNTDADTDATSELNPQLTTDGIGNWIAVWSSGEPFRGAGGFDRDIFYSRSTDNGASWTAPAALSSNAATDTGFDSEPQLTTDGAGNWIAVWRSNDDLGGAIGTDGDILCARSTDNGATWTTVAPLNTNAATDSGGEAFPQLTTDSAGNWIASWYSFDNLGETIGNDADIVFSRSTDNGATWTAPAPLNSNATTDSGGDYWQELTTDGAGNWIAVWSSLNNLGGTIGDDWDILFARSTDNGATWTAPAPLNSFAATDGEDDLRARLTTDPEGNWVAVWNSEHSLLGTIGTDGDILYSQSADNGVTWTAAAPLNSNATIDSGYDQKPQLTTDGAGHWILVWESYGDFGGTIGADTDILFSRFTLSTTSLDINLNGVPDECEPVCNSDGDFDGDGDVDLTDYLGFAACFGGPAESAADHCACFDLDVDGDVDLHDVARFQEGFSGPN
ncbi:MAG TPA: sialidase family protein [Phycisphaerae bacterium]|nr:sialidase family protein [Phycisphaerae bacterium]